MVYGKKKSRVVINHLQESFVILFQEYYSVSYKLDDFLHFEPQGAALN